MKSSLWLRVDALARRLTPFGLTLVLVILGVLPLHLPGYERVVPLLPLMAVYHWTIYRPELLPAYAVFVIGLLQDTLGGTPIGVNAVVYLCVYGMVISQRTFFVGKSFAIEWLGFALVAAGAMGPGWLLVPAYNMTPVSPHAAPFQYLVTLGTFPTLAWVFLRRPRTFLGQE